MKLTFACALGIMVLLSLVAWRLQPADSAAGKVSLTWVSDTNPLREAQAKLFNHDYPKYDIQVDPSNGDLEKVIVQSLGGVGPDVFDCGNSYELASYVRSGVAADVTDELKKRGIDVESQTFKGIHGAAIYEGRVYGVPTNMAADGIWFHKDIFDEAHLPYPTGAMKWAEFIKLAQKLTLRDGAGHINRYGFLFEWWAWRDIFAGFGARLYSKDGTRCTVDSSEAIAAVQLMSDLVYKYHVAPTPSEEAGMSTQGGFGSGYISYFGSKRGAMALGGRWWLSQLRQMTGLNAGVFPSPYETTNAQSGYGRAALINKNSKHFQAALDFLSYLASPDYNQLIDSQADGIAAFKKYDDGPSFERDPAYPKEDQNQVWRAISESAVPDEISPFVDGSVANRLLQNQFDLVQNGIKQPAQAMLDAAKNINEEIQTTISQDPNLRQRYLALVSQATKP